MRARGGEASFFAIPEKKKTLTCNDLALRNETPHSIYTEQRQSFIRQSMVWDQRSSLDGNGDPVGAAPPGFAAHGRSFSSVSKSSNLRNEVKLAGENDEEDEELTGDTSYTTVVSPPRSGTVPRHGVSHSAATNANNKSSSSDGYLDTGLYASPTKHSYQSSVQSNFSGQYANSRSNLAPENTSPAYQTEHQRNRSNLSNSVPAEYNSQYSPQYHGHSPYNQQQQPYASRDSRYDDAGEDEFTSYYTTR